jgi:hypothetical protein
MAWESISTLPQDGRRVLFTRSVDNSGSPVDVVQGPDLDQVFGWIGIDGKVVVEQVLVGDVAEDWEPTHWYPDPAFDKPPS